MSISMLLFVLGLIPEAAPWVPLLTKWAPVLEAGLPIAEDLVKRGAQTLGAFQSAHPKLVDAFKEFAALQIHGDASRADEITDDEAIAFASPLLGRPWTATDVKRWNDKATGLG